MSCEFDFACCACCARMRMPVGRMQLGTLLSLLAFQPCRLDHIFATFRTAAGRLRRMDVILVRVLNFEKAFQKGSAVLQHALKRCAYTPHAHSSICQGALVSSAPRPAAAPQVTPDQLPYALIGWIGERWRLGPRHCSAGVACGSAGAVRLGLLERQSFMRHARRTAGFGALLAALNTPAAFTLSPASQHHPPLLQARLCSTASCGGT